MSNINPIQANGNNHIDQNQVFASRSPRGLEIHNVKPGSQINIQEIDGKRILFVDNQALMPLKSYSKETQFVLHGKGLTRDNVCIKGEKGVSTNVTLTNEKGKVGATFTVKYDPPEEKKNFLQEYKDAPIVPFGSYQKGGFISGIKGKFS